MAGKIARQALVKCHTPEYRDDEECDEELSDSDEDRDEEQDRDYGDD